MSLFDELLIGGAIGYMAAGGGRRHNNYQQPGQVVYVPANNVVVGAPVMYAQQVVYAQPMQPTYAAAPMYQQPMPMYQQQPMIPQGGTFPPPPPLVLYAYWGAIADVTQTARQASSAGQPLSVCDPFFQVDPCHTLTKGLVVLAGGSPSGAPQDGLLQISAPVQCAFYGCFADVSARVRALVNAASFGVDVSCAAMGCDPAPGIRKQLAIVVMGGRKNLLQVTWGLEGAGVLRVDVPMAPGDFWRH